MITKLIHALSFLVMIIVSSFSQASDIEQCKINTDQSIKINNVVSINIHPEQVLKRESPELLLGFNANALLIQRDLYSNKANYANDSALTLLSDLPGIAYRYPGGTLSNHFNWKWSIGDLDERPKQKIVRWLDPVTMQFGLNDFVSFIDKVGGVPLYVANLVGWDNLKYEENDLDIDTIKSSNIELAQYLNKMNLPKFDNLLIELGNELDRGSHQWSTERYIKRAKVVADDINKILPKARLLIPLRAWNWKYKGSEKSRGKQKGSEMVTETMKAFSDVYGVSFHIYYHPDGNKYPYWDMRKRLDLVEKNYFNIIKSNNNKNLKVWITEHAIQRLDQYKTGKMSSVSPPMQSALMSAQFFTLLFSKPFIEGAHLHALNGGAFNDSRWKVLSVDEKTGDVKGMPVYWMLKLLRSVLAQKTIEIDIQPKNLSYDDGGDLSALLFSHDHNGKLSFFLVNSGASQIQVDIGGDFLANKNMLLEWSILCDQEKEPVYQNEGMLEFSGSGKMLVTIPQYSISTIEITKGEE